MENPLRINHKNNYSYREVDLVNTLRRLWQEHGIWTRSFIISTVAGLPDLEAVTERLLRNPADFAAVLKPLFGSRRAGEFEELLREHLLIAANLLNNLKAGKNSAAAEDKKEWYRNADEIAALLARINPFWDEKEWQKMLHEHLKLVENEAGKRLSGQYAEDIIVFDELSRQAMEMADEMAQGIIRQFRL